MSGWVGWLLIEWSHLDVTTALVDFGGVVCSQCWQGFTRSAPGLGAVLGIEAKMRGFAVIPPRIFVIRYAVHNGVFNVGSRQRAAHKLR